MTPRQHNQLLLPMIDALLADAAVQPSQLDAVAFGCGPGSFTGVRIAASVTQGIALGRDILALPISTLRVLAQTAMATYPEVSTLLATIRSRPGEIYVGRYHRVDGICHQQGDEAVMRTPAVDLPDDCAADWCVVGDAADELAGALVRRNLRCTVDSAVLPRASALLTLAQYEFDRGAGVTAAFALPVYLEGTAPWRKLTD